MGVNFAEVADALLMRSPAAIDNIWDGGGTMVWRMRLDSYGPTGSGRVADKTTSTGGATGWGLRVNSGLAPINSLQLEVDFSTTQGIWISPNNSILTAVWYSCAVTYNSDAVGNDPVFYIDGVLVATTENTTPVGTRVSDAAVEMVIGNFDDLNRSFDGDIADLRFYDRVLPADEIQTIHASGGRDRIVDGLVMALPLRGAPPPLSSHSLLRDLDFAAIATSLTITVPVPDHVDGVDKLVMVIASSGDTTGTPENITTPAGWVHRNAGQTDLPATASTPSIWIYDRAASSEPANYVVTGNQAVGDKRGVILAYPMGAFDVASTINTGTSSTPSSPSITSGGDAMCLRVMLCDDNEAPPDWHSVSDPGINVREVFEVGPTSPNGFTLGISDEMVASGATGTHGWTLNASDQWGALTFTWLGGAGVEPSGIRDSSDNNNGGDCVAVVPVATDQLRGAA